MGNARLFIVEDEILLAVDLKRKLESKGYIVLGIASSGDEAVKKVLELQPDLVLMDIHLKGDTDGIQAASQVQARVNLPVIYLTAYADRDTLARAQITSPYGYILKPYEENELEVNIEINLHKNRLDQELRETAASLARSLEELKRSNALIAALGQVAARIQQNLHPVKIVKTLGEELELLGIHCAVLLSENEGDEELAVYYISLPEDQIGLLEQKIGTKLVGYKFKEDRYLELLNIEPAAPESRHLYIPLGFAELIFGGLLIWGPGFYEQDTPAMKVFADQFAIAMETSRLFLETQHISNTDPLTGIYNRRYFLEFAQREFDRYQRHGREFSIIMLDLDFFKEVNDRHGHLGGDQVLNQVVQRIREVLRSSDTLARFGGEEFIVLLSETDLRQAVQVAERIRLEISKSPLFLGSEPVTVSASLGVAQIDTFIHTLESLIHYADMALYRAKSKGRNCVFTA